MKSDEPGCFVQENMSGGFRRFSIIAALLTRQSCFDGSNTFQYCQVGMSRSHRVKVIKNVDREQYAVMISKLELRMNDIRPTM